MLEKDILASWENFYIIVGSSAGALIGLQFVVMTLIAEKPLSKSEAEAGDAFGTPNIIHFSVVLLISAIVSVPWHTITFFSISLGMIGLSGGAFVLVTGRRMRLQSVYKPVLEDWVFYVVLPLMGYAMLA